jgi:hypothetical protein
MVEDVVENGVSGLITREPTPKEFAELTGGLLANPTDMRRMAEAARERIVQKFTWRVSVRQAPRLYQTAMERFWLARGQAGNAFSFDVFEQNWRAVHMPLEKVQVMVHLSTELREECLYIEKTQMVKELFRVRNRWPATCLAFSAWIRHPTQTAPLIMVLLVGWFGNVRMVLGRWKGKALAVFRINL